MTEVDPTIERDKGPADLSPDQFAARLRRVPEPRRRQSREGEPAEHLAHLQQLELRLTRLERLVSSVRADDPSELELLDPEFARLAQTAQRAHDLAATLATPEVRSACQLAIENWEQWQHRYRKVLDAALSASRTIAITSAGQHGSRTDAVARFDSARTELAELHRTRQGLSNAATYARRQLERDQAVRDRSQHEIDAGYPAWRTLVARLQDLVIGAVEGNDSLPAWLVIALGPAATSNPSRWQNLATQILAYRITYAVSDRVEPLGPQPRVEDSSRRRRWYRELAQQLAGC